MRGVRAALEAFRRGEVMAGWDEGFDEWSYRAEEFIDAGNHVGAFEDAALSDS